jgi:molecular chaperone Hsp33
MTSESPDRIERFHSEDLSFRAAVVISTNTVQQICDAHQALPLARIAMGRLASGAAALAAHSSEGVVVGVHMQGDGPLGFLFAEATYEGEVRAHCANPQLDVPGSIPQEQMANLAIGPAVGRGNFTVTRSLPFEKQPFVATVPIIDGEIGNDLAFYLHQSFQVPSVVSVGVFLGSDGRVEGAGAVLIELMPGASEFTARMLERHAANAPSLSRMIAAGKTAQDILHEYVGEMTMRKSAGEDRDLRFVCRCSMARVERAMILLGPHEIEDMIRKSQPVHVKCEFCNKPYTVELERLKTLRSGF